MPRKRSGKHYFTKDHENAIIQYVATDDQRIRTELYVEYIGPAFNEMVDKIVYTYKFTNLPNIDALKGECKVWLTTILDKYDPSKGSKAFSYFSVITKNWFIHKVKKNAKRARTEVLYDELPKAIENERLVTHNRYHTQREEKEFWISALRLGEKITEKPRIRISTIHGAKGAEADHVALVTDISLDRNRTLGYWQPEGQRTKGSRSSKNLIKLHR